MNLPIKKIISGAQTGADQGGLDAAIALGLDCGGMMPRGRRTDRGILPDRLFQLWNLEEHESSAYPPRTRENVLSADGTVLFGKTYSRGSKLTLKICDEYDKPIFIVSQAALLNKQSLYKTNIMLFQKWLVRHNIGILNVAGNRERINPDIYIRTKNFLVEALSE